MRRGQGSVEILFVLAIIIILSFIVVGKFFFEQDDVFTRASARQIVVSELEKLDKKYNFIRVDSVKCSTGNIRMDIELNPNPVSGGSLDPSIAGIQPKVMQLVKQTTTKNMAVDICYNEPQALTLDAQSNCVSVNNSGNQNSIITAQCQFSTPT